MTFQEYIKGKSVCVVGPSPILQNRGLGREIESFDVVIKTGNAPSIDSPQYLADYGHRVDVLYVNRSTFADFKEIPVREWKSRGVKYVRVRTTDAALSSVHFHTEKIPKEFYAPLSEAKDDVPLMGSVILKELISAGAKRIFLTGVDFNTSRGATKHAIDLPPVGDFKEYVPGYLSENMQKRLNNVRHHRSKDAHDHYANAVFIKSVIDAGLVDAPDFVLEKLTLILAVAQPPGQKAQMETQC